MIDFALRQLRWDDDEDWFKGKAFADEEGGVGRVMERILKGMSVYRRSEFYK